MREGEEASVEKVKVTKGTLLLLTPQFHTFFHTHFSHSLPMLCIAFHTHTHTLMQHCGLICTCVAMALFCSYVFCFRKKGRGGGG